MVALVKFPGLSGFSGPTKCRDLWTGNNIVVEIVIVIETIDPELMFRYPFQAVPVSQQK